jgi:hypothetical protein
VVCFSAEIQAESETGDRKYNHDNEKVENHQGNNWATLVV